MRRPSLLQSFGLLIAVSLVAGILTAGMALPFVGGLGLAARSATNNFESLPAEIKAKPLPQISKVVADDGSTIANFYSQYRFVVPLSAIPLRMQQALIDVEDVRFYEHGGVDFKGTLRALLHNGSSGTVVQGGSTLTQQYVKNLLLENARTKKQREAAVADTLARKIREAKLAIGLEKTLTKSQILDRYFNIAYFGDGAYGIGAAARHFFDEKVQDLTLDQSALLAGLVQSPEAYNPIYYPHLATERRATVLGQMLKYHSIDQATYQQAMAQPIKLKVHDQPNDCVSAKYNSYAYFCDYVKHVFEQDKALGGLANLRRGGLTITTTLDPKIQAAAVNGIHAYVHKKEPDKVVSAEAVVQPGTGEVKALAVSQPYGNDQKKGQNSIDYAVDEKFGGSHGFPAGSTFKLFVLTAALKEGIPLYTTINSPGTLTDVTGYTKCNGATTTYPEVSNADPAESGNYNLETGTWFSVNTFFAQLEQRTGLCTPVKLAEAMGVKQGDGSPPQQYPSFTLGSGGKYGFTPLDLAGAYATMANHGTYCSPIVITKIVDRNGNSLPVPKTQCTRVVPSGLANTVTQILEGVLTQTGATGTTDILDNRPAAAKTGTVDGYKGSWFAGYTPQLASAVWAGIPSNPNKSLEDLTIGGIPYGAVFGATLAGKIWQATMNAALLGEKVEEFSGPDDYYQLGITTPVPYVAGDSVGNAKATLSAAGFTPTVSGNPVDSAYPAGQVAYTSPGAGESASPGETVTIYISDGTAPAPTHSPSPSTSPTPSNTPTQPTGGGTPSAPVSPGTSPNTGQHGHGGQHRRHRRH